MRLQRRRCQVIHSLVLQRFLRLSETRIHDMCRIKRKSIDSNSVVWPAVMKTLTSYSSNEQRAFVFLISIQRESIDVGDDQLYFSSKLFILQLSRQLEVTLERTNLLQKRIYTDEKAFVFLTSIEITVEDVQNKTNINRLKQCCLTSCDEAFDILLLK